MRTILLVIRILIKKTQNYWLSDLRKKNLLDSGTKVNFYRKREHESKVYFTESSVESEKFAFCHNVKRHPIHMVLPFYAPQWWKALYWWFQKEFEDDSVPIRYSVQLEEKFKEIRAVLKLIDNHKWIICADLKMVNFL